MYAQNLSQMFHVPPEQILAIAKGGAPGGQQGGGATPLDAAGTPQGGQQ